MGLRPAKCYRRLERPYTRVATRVVERNYIGTVPVVRIRRFESGNPNGDYDYKVELVCESDLQIRDRAVEAARVAAVKYLEKKTGGTFFLKVRVFPHHILRENKQLTGAGADRLQKGMRRAFGRPTERAVQAIRGTVILEARVKEGALDVAREALRRAKMKLPGKYKILVSKL